MTNNIAKFIKEIGKKIKSISDALDISYSTLSSCNQGIRKPKKRMLKNLLIILEPHSPIFLELMMRNMLHQI
nr:hypothetical protein [Streptococcus cuniculipharyngis]